MRRKGFTVVFVLVISMIFTGNLYAQVIQQDNEDVDVVTVVEKEPLPPAKGTLLVRLHGGFGFDNHDIGETTEGDDIHFSGGGGAGISAMGKYNLDDKWRTGFEIGWQRSTLLPEVNNVSGTFGRTYFRPTVELSVPFLGAYRLNLGGGVGYYLAGDFDLDMADVPDGAHNIYDYENAVGPNVYACI